MKTNITSWPHAPEHRLSERGTYIVTCGTYRKQHHLNTPGKLTLVRNLLFELALNFEWSLQAWAIMSNHYHFIASSPDDASTLKKMISTLHTLSAREFNRINETPKRRVWYNYYDTRITYEKSWIARLNYVHHNPVHHGVVHNAELYEWCSAAWFTREAGNAFVKTVNSFKIDQIKVYDEYGPFGVRQLDGALKSGGSTPVHMECAGPKDNEDARLRFKKTCEKPSKSAVEPAHSKAASPHSKSSVTPEHSKSGVNPPHSAPSVHRCKYCNSTAVVKAGTRKLKSGIKQLYKCNDCLRKFSSLHRNSKQTDPDIILKSLIAACRSYTYEEIQRFVKRRYQKQISTSVISKWIKEYHPPYLKMRERNNTVSKIVISNVFTHRDLNYNFQIHVPKLADCPLKELKDYLIKVPAVIDHHLFETADRCSAWMNPNLSIAVNHSQNTQATKDALKALQFSKTNYQRHDVVEQFMFNCDAYTIACEVPVWMSPLECGGLTPLLNPHAPQNVECGGLSCEHSDSLRVTALSNMPSQSKRVCSGSTALSNNPAPQSKSGVERLSPAFGPPHSKPLPQKTIAGHIDLLQWKFNTLYILDFKPNAKKENKQKVASQLMLYAIALSVRAEVPLEQMRCAWFDGEDFYSFRPQNIWSAPA